MSAKMIAASRSKALIGCSVTSHASSGVLISLQDRVPLAQRAVFGHVAAGLAHQPDGRAHRTGWRRQARRKRLVCDVAHRASHPVDAVIARSHRAASLAK